MITYFSGHFEKGEMNNPLLIQNTSQFKHTFGRAITENTNEWYQAYNYLQYNDSILVNRIEVESMNSFGAYPWLDTPTLILNDEDFIEKYDSISLESYNKIKFIARTPGTWGNILSVAMFTLREHIDNVVILNDLRAQDIVDSMKEGDYCLCVIRLDQVVEVFVKSSYVMQEVNVESNYIYVKETLLPYTLVDGNLILADGSVFDEYNPDTDGNLEYDFVPIFYGETIIALDGGFQDEPTMGEVIDSYTLAESKENYEIDVIIGNERNNQSAIDLAENRRDCVAVVGVPYFNLKGEAQYSKAIQDYVDTLSASQFACIIGNQKYQLDRFTDTYVWVNIAGDVAGLFASGNHWDANAGTAKGNIKNARNIMIKFSRTNTDILYQKSINGINFSTQGTYLNSQKTFLLENSSFSRVNTRMLFNYLERECYKLLLGYVFDENILDTRRNISIEIKNKLVDVRSDRGIDSGKVEVHGEDKTIIVDVFVKPLYVAEFIQMRIITTPSGSSTAFKSGAL